MCVIFHKVMKCIARQAVFTGQRGYTTVFNPAQSAVSCGPQRTIPIELKSVDAAVPQAVSGPVERADLTVFEINHTTAPGCQPQTAVYGIRYHSIGIRATNSQI